MSLLVQKFGGTSVGTPERIRAVADRIAATVNAGHQLVVVVSAMGHSTDELISLAHQVSPSPPHREMDMLLTAGERISMALLSMALFDRKVRAVSLTGSQSGIITDSSHRRARILEIKGDRVKSAIAEGKVAIVAGFQGVSREKEITTLGRGGSDTTAVALAASLGADLCEIYTDVDGVYSADPRKVPEARLWPELPASLMLEMAIRGAGVLDPRSIELAYQHRVRLRVRNSFNSSEGTEIIMQQEKGMESFGITGVSADDSKCLLTIELMRPTVTSAVFDQAAKSNLAILTPVFSEGKLQLFVEKDSLEEWKKHLSALSADGFVRKFESDEMLIPLSVVGNRFSQDGTALQEVMDTLAQAGISVTMGVAGALAITVAVPATHRDEGLQALHRRFLPRQSNGGTA